jgi:hypothetical protein
MTSGVVMDIAAFKVSHSIGTDKDATALRAARARSSCIHRGHGTFTHGFDLRESSPPTATQHIATVKTPAGRWMKCHRRFKMQALTDCCDAKFMSTRTAAGQFKGHFKGAESSGKAHMISGVVVDIAAFKVSHSVGIDIDATALRAARARSSYIHRGNGGTVWEGSKSKLKKQAQGDG